MTRVSMKQWDKIVAALKSGARVKVSGSWWLVAETHFEIDADRRWLRAAVLRRPSGTGVQQLFVTAG